MVVAGITSDADDYVLEVTKLLKQHNIRVLSDIRNEKINYKIREHSVAKVPIIFAIGEREMTHRTVNMRRLGSKNTETILTDEAVKLLKKEATPPDMG